MIQSSAALLLPNDIGDLLVPLVIIIFFWILAMDDIEKKIAKMEALFRYHGITVDINHKLKPNAKTKLTRAEINRLQIQYDKLLAEREEALKAIP